MGNQKLAIIGLTGGIGSGKSTISRLLALRGGHILDADEINHGQMRPGMHAYREIVKQFGKRILLPSGEIDRRGLASVVFGDETLLQTLVDITHGHVIAATVLAIEALQTDNQGHRFIVIDAPLLIEANMHAICDAVWVVVSDDETRVARVMARDNLSREQVLSRMQKQIPQAALAGYADCLLDNNGGFDALERQVNDGLRRLGLEELT